MSTEAEADLFINTPLTPETMDLYHTRRSIKKAIEENMQVFKGILLDLGCGEMPYRQFIASNGKIEKYIGMDIENPEYQRNGKPDLFWDGKRIPLGDGSVDCVLATEFFEHIPHPERTLAEVRRVLKPEGALLFTVPFLWPLHTMPNDEFRYTPFAMERLLIDSGFDKIDIKAHGGWDASLAQMIGLWVNRRPMSDTDRNGFSRTLFPFYRDLLEFESQGGPPTREEMSRNSMMITGLTGVARKPASPCGKPVLAIVCPQVGAPSETFIRKHIESLMPGRTVLLTGNVLDPSWFQGPILKIPIRLGAYSFDKEQEEEVARFLKEHGVTHILCEFGCIGGAVVALNRERLRLPIHVHFHGQDASEFIRRPEIADYYRWMGSMVDGVIAVSKPMAERLARVGIPEGKTRIIHYGVDFPGECRVAHEKNPCRFLSVSRLVGKKGIPFILRAFEKTREAFPDATLDIVGDGPLRAEVEEFILEHGLGESVRLHGEQAHGYVLERMDASSVFLQHSVVDPDTGNAEGLPLSILEASAHGLPVISTLHEGIPEAVEHGRTGFLVEERDWEAMAGFMVKLAGDGTLREKMGAAGREKISGGGFTTAAMIRNLGDFMGLNPSCATGGDRTPAEGNMKRILFVNHSIYPFEISGTPLSTRNHALGMAKRGAEVAVLIPRAEVEEGYRKERTPDGYTLYQVPAMDRFEAYFAGPGEAASAEILRTVERILEDFRPQLVQVNDYVCLPAEILEIFSRKGCIVVREVCNCEELCHLDYPVIPNGLYGRLCSGPETARKCAKCFASRTDTGASEAISREPFESIEEKVERRFEYVKRLYRDVVDRVIFTSEPFRDYYTRFVPVSAEKVRVIPRGFDFRFPRKLEREKGPGDVVRFALVGNVMFNKGVGVALQAFEKAFDGNNLAFHVYGRTANPEDSARLKMLETRYPGRFLHHGTFGEKDLPAIASHVDVCIVPSYFDTYNRVLREFLYLGVPVIATDFFGAYIVEDGRNGYRVPVGDADALAEKMTELIRHPERIEVLARGAAQTRIPTLAEEIDAMAETYEDLPARAAATKNAAARVKAGPAESGGATAGDAFRAFAFYLPQFHPIPENDHWWGKGFTEWSNVAKSRPLFPGHDQPHVPADLGFYDLRLPEVRKAQADLARKYGIEGFCYWHYWFNGKRLLDLPFRSVLQSGKPDFPFCLAWANETWSRRWLGEERNVLMKQEYSEEDDRNHALWLVTAFRDRRYVKVNGRPLFLIYRPKDLPEPRNTVEILRRICRQKGLEDPYLVGINSHCTETDLRMLGFDETLYFMPQLSFLPECMNDDPGESKRRRNAALGVDSAKLKIYDYEEAMDAMLAGMKKLRHPVIPSLFVGWDNTPRRSENGIIITNASPKKFGRALQSLADSVQGKPAQQRFVFLNAWNEWAEGNHLEPDTRNGHKFLEEVRKAKSGGKARGKDPQPATVPAPPRAEREDPEVRAIAFYLPQYHPTPENDRWWGKGFTEWT
ncbi:MAG: glycosyl transferase group 1, partial [Deltaproteobacteria bacterium]|nr:glycosyl transferase group 1 [Deltaproteobacteria bacterium]